MVFEISNLGAVKSAKFDLTKRLTVFCGHNNTGKTYVSYIIYALTNCRKLVPKMLPDHILDALKEQGRATMAIDAEELCQYRSLMLGSVTANLKETFGISAEQAEKFFKDFTINFLTTDEEFRVKINAEAFDDDFTSDHFIVHVTKQPSSLNLSFNLTTTHTLDSKDIDTIRFVLLPRLFTRLALYPITESVIFPVERNSIYTFSKELSIKRNILIDQMQDLSTKPIDPMDYLLRRTTRYPQPIRDGLEVAEDMEHIQRHQSPFHAFAEDIEQALLYGRVSVTGDGEVQFAPAKAKSKKLPIHLTASIVKTLSSLVFYLKHLAKPNDLIIIDEPELNLHPDNQIVLARIFARLVGEGFRLLVSTHSDYIIREINNLIMLNSDTEAIGAVREKLGYTADERLDHTQTAVYFFDFKKSGRASVTVKPIAVTDTGFEVPSIDATIERQNKVSDELYYALKY